MKHYLIFDTTHQQKSLNRRYTYYPAG